MWSIIAVTNKHTAKLHHVGSLYILTYDAQKLKHKIVQFCFIEPVFCLVLREESVSQTKFEFGGFGEGKIVKFVGFPARKSV